MINHPVDQSVGQPVSPFDESSMSASRSVGLQSRPLIKWMKHILVTEKEIDSPIIIYIYTGLFISPSGISELDCATTKTDTAERSISIGRESLQTWNVSLSLSLSVDMLLSAVSVLVVAQSSSEILEGLMKNPVYIYIWGVGRVAQSVKCLTTAGRFGIEFRWGRDFPPVQTGPGAHPAYCTMGTGSFPGAKWGRCRPLTPF